MQTTYIPDCLYDIVTYCVICQVLFVQDEMISLAKL